MKLIILLSLLFSTSQVFSATIPVTVKATADRYFVAVLSEGSNHTLVSPMNPADWSIPKNTVIQVPDGRLKTCSIDFITWGYRSIDGFAATLSGNNGTLHTSNPLIKSYRSPVRLVGNPSLTDIHQILGSIIPYPTRIDNVGQWGAPVLYGFDPAVNWISTRVISEREAKGYSVFRFPCESLVKKTVVRPRPIPGPPQTPVPRPPVTVNVKGDHFACYMLEKGPDLAPEQITITDQFGSAKVILGMPKMICNPSEKIHRRQNFVIEDKERHLVCYEIVEQSPNKDYELEIQNQFETRKVTSTNRELFCVPSLKKHL